MRCFVDTNVWLYALIEAREADRTRIAQEIVAKPDVAISTQVINELCVNLLRKARVPEDDADCQSVWACSNKAVAEQQITTNTKDKSPGRKLSWLAHVASSANEP